MMFHPSSTQIKEQIVHWLKEDVGSGDVTTLSTIPEGHVSKGLIHAKQAGIACGMKIAQWVFEVVDATVSFEPLKADGDTVQQGDTLAIVEGSSRSILIGERLALNLLQRMSGIATRTHEYAQQVAGTAVRLVDTRKTTPGHRLLEKYAVQVGGGHNHRFGLYDAVMIKDNHIKAAGGIQQAVEQARAAIPHTMKIEVETENLAQVEQALAAGADIIMLDNMRHEEMRTAVSHIQAHSPHVVTEASGGVTLHTIAAIAACGVDVISVGRLTNDISPLDISLDLNEKKKGGRP
ncbi:carboxylating nicotinate-nucleotide diphosphorylase [Marinicrinis sediminis]|uniref:nicotinate-nucleotide diphosphorylase (carboxylating) n=1 Tax=Marinicrinis sediminis TaxID=1652465 RepID=A0ABW5RBR2_9BACL